MRSEDDAGVLPFRRPLRPPFPLLPPADVLQLLVLLVLLVSALVVELGEGLRVHYQVPPAALPVLDDIVTPVQP